MSNSNDLIHEIERALKKVEREAAKKIPRLIGNAAVEHFKENFDKGGFVDGGVNKWADVKRRDSSSPWYGFDYKGEHRTSYKFKREKKTGKTKKAAKQKKLNFSKAATVRPVMQGATHELQRSIRCDVSGTNITISSDKPYAQIHNDGGTVKVFGKHSATMPQRQFIGESKELNAKIESIIDTNVEDIINKAMQ